MVFSKTPQYLVGFEYSTLTTLQGKSHSCIPRKGIARPQSHFPHSCVCEQFTCGPHTFLQQNRQTNRGNI
jgi:hypothetical protein